MKSGNDSSKHPGEDTSVKPKRERKTQADRIIETAVATRDMPIPMGNDMAFVSKILVQAFLPHRDPDDLTWERTNGDFTLYVKSGLGRENKKTKVYGIPYGAIPRILMAYINSEALKNSKDETCENPRVIYLGNSLSDFLRKIGVQNTGGVRGGITSFKKQAERLFHAEITVIYKGKQGYAERDIKISDGRFIFWGSAQHEGQPSLWDSSVELSERFYSLLVNNPAPMDWRVLKAIKQSPMALDLYMWLTHRMSYLQKPTEIKWETLQEQLGSDTTSSRKFRQLVRQHLVKIQSIWADLKIDADSSECIRLYPSKLLIPQSKASHSMNLLKSL